MSQSGRWWIGLVPLALLWVAANFWGTERIEKDIAGRAGAALQRAGGAIQPPKIQVQGRDVAVATVVPDQDAVQRMAQTILEETGVRRVDAADVALPPVARPFTFSVAREGADLVLSGSVPSEAMRQSVLSAARAAAGTGKVIDRLTIALGAPQGFEAMALHGLAQAAKLQEGVFALSDGAYALHGAASDFATLASVREALKNLPAGASLGKSEILAPEIKPFVWSARSDGKAVTLEGVVADAAEQARLNELAGKMGTVVDTTEVARGAPGNFASAVAFGLNALARLAQGKATLREQVLTLEGTGKDGVNAETLLAEAKSLPAGFSLIVDAIVPAPVRPFTFAIEKTAAGYALSGFAPSAAARDAALSAVRAKLGAGETLSGTLQIASGLPEGIDFGAAWTYALTQLAALNTGVARLSESTVSFAGEMSDGDMQALMRRLQAELPKGVTLDTSDIKETRVAVAAPADAVPTEPAPAPTVAVPPVSEPSAAAPSVPAPVPPRPVLPPVVAAPALTPPTAPEPLAPSLPDPGQRPSSDAAGSPPLTPSTAEAPLAPALDPPRLRPAGGGSASALGPTSVSCTPVQGEPIAQVLVHFDPASRVLKPAEARRLDAVIQAAKTCAQAQIIIAGHTDSQGPRSGNIPLSSRRAFAASRYLIANGVARSRIKTIGYGEDRRVVQDDASAQERAVNRRVVVEVR